MPASLSEPDWLKHGNHVLFIDVSDRLSTDVGRRKARHCTEPVVFELLVLELGRHGRVALHRSLVERKPVLLRGGRRAKCRPPLLTVGNWVETLQDLFARTSSKFTRYGEVYVVIGT